MLTKILLAALAPLLLVTPQSHAQPGQSPPFASITEKQGGFDDVAFFVRQAIIQKGFTVDATSQIGEMLARTAQDVGATRTVYKNAVALQFCSVRLARAMVEADPATIALCPTIVFVYELADKPGIVHVGYRTPPRVHDEATQKAIDDLHQTLDEIVAEALQ
jgi:hypothetical protein